ncbi:hypothetical protein AT5G33393 [Arabidopsis thaliana]|uniref:Zinc finger GRF-type domain-containing protein n=2 Tax=Arabidopsis thaliana TaxID=3702 RepID=F4KH99_ARATH|nr:uncharacterized protein AT5G33393 [Arabidopsis thaliana]AED93900.1 hypothetical protein AT5G33393 [Arabidopsis thaliana]|eukprot:NP_680296.1 hypothetical protein AT5G33393 [Arabidopsis thaliana]
MSASQISKSDANNSKMSFGQGSYGHSSWGRSCNCGRSTTKIKSWTDDNSGRRFFRCDVHGFVSWSDVEKQCTWQKLSLLEARDELKALKESLRTPINQQAIKEEEETKKLEEETKKLEVEKKTLEEEKKFDLMFCNGDSLFAKTRSPLMLASDSVTLRIDTSNVHQEVVISMVNNGDNIVQDVMQQQEGCDYAVLIRKTEFSKATMMLTKSGAVQPKAFILPTPQVPASKLEPSLRFNNESLVVVTNQQMVYQVLDTMSPQKERLKKRKLSLSPKNWMFKFKNLPHTRYWVQEKLWFKESMAANVDKEELCLVTDSLLKPKTWQSKDSLLVIELSHQQEILSEKQSDMEMALFKERSRSKKMLVINPRKHAHMFHDDAPVTISLNETVIVQPSFASQQAPQRLAPIQVKQQLLQAQQYTWNNDDQRRKPKHSVVD